MTADDSAAPRNEFRDGWSVVLAATTGVVVSYFHVYSLSVFIEPLEQAFGWSRTQVTSATMISAMVAVIAYTVVGLGLDRYGARRMALAGLTIYCPALALLSTAGPSIWTWWLGYALVNIGHIMAGVTVWTSGVASRFDRHRGLALGMTLAGTGIATAALPTLANALVERFGWDGAYIGLGIIAALLALPMTYLLFHDRRSLATTDGRTLRREVRGADGLTVRQALRTPTFWRLAAVALLMTAVLLGLIVHFVPMLSEAGVSRSRAVEIAGLIGIASISGRLASGFLLDRMPASLVGAVFLLLPALAFGGLLLGNQAPALWYWLAIAAGLALGSETDVIAYATTRYFGLRSYGVVFGLYASLMTIGAGIGPTIGGYIHDRTGSYEPFIMGAILISLVCALLIATLATYPARPRSLGQPGPAAPAEQ